jgi:hypothetical protein
MRPIASHRSSFDHVDGAHAAGPNPSGTLTDAAPTHTSIKTPLTYDSAVYLASEALCTYTLESQTTQEVALALMDVDRASREQAVEPLLSGLRAIEKRCAEQGDAVARQMAALLLDIAAGR